MISTQLLTPILLGLSVMFTACDRPFREVGQATVEIVSPDVSEAQDRDRIDLELRVTSVRGVTSVRSGNVAFSPAGTTDIWKASLDLDPGLNRFLIETAVDDGPVSIDTVDVLRISWSVESKTSERWLLSGVGSHSATRLQDGSLVLIGGSVVPGGSGGFDAWTLPPGGSRFTPALTQSVAPRVGHTATLLPDGRILLLGGGESGNVDSVNNLIEIAEVYDPATESFTQVPVSGAPIRRMYHTALLRIVGNATYVVLLGGRGDTQYTPAPALGIRQDMRTFEWRNNALVALSPAVGPFIRSVAGHSQQPLDPAPAGLSSEYLVSGMDFENDYAGVSLTMDFDAPAGIDVLDAGPILTPRIRHAAVSPEPGVIVLFGGRPIEGDAPLQSGEIFIHEANRYFRFPAGLEAAITAAYGHTATLMTDGRILLVGGFDAGGQSLNTVDFVSLGLD